MSMSNIWTNLSWLIVGFSIAIIIGILTTPVYAHAQAIPLAEQKLGTSTETGAEYKIVPLGTNYSGAITEIYVYTASTSEGSQIRIRLYKCDENQGDNPTATGLALDCTYEQTNWDAEFLSPIANPYGTGWQHKFSGIYLTTELTSNSLVLLNNKYYYLGIYGHNVGGVKKTNYVSNTNYDTGGTHNFAFRILGTSFIGPSYIYNKSPTSLSASTTVPVSFYYALAPTDNVVKMELKLQKTGYSTVVTEIGFSSNTGSSTSTFTMPSGQWNASVWFTNTNGYTWKCDTCSWNFEVFGSTITSDEVYLGSTTLNEWAESALISTGTISDDLNCGLANFDDWGGCLYTSIFNAIGNLFGIKTVAQAFPTIEGAYNAMIDMEFLQPIWYGQNWAKSLATVTPATSSDDHLILTYDQLGASGTVNILWDDVSNLTPVRMMRDYAGDIMYFVLGLLMVSFVAFGILGNRT